MIALKYVPLAQYFKQRAKMKNNLKKIMKKRGITQMKLFELSGVPQSIISTSLKKDPSFEVALRIAVGLEMNVYDIWPDADKLKNAKLYTGGKCVIRNHKAWSYLVFKGLIMNWKEFEVLEELFKND
jgi:DNA-binding XRE family transcriptional regulator